MIANTGSQGTAASPVVFSAAEHDSQRLRLPHGSVARELFDNPWKFDFFQAVLLLQQVAGEGRDGTAAPVGRFSLPSKEAMRFGVPNSLAFPRATIQAVTWDFERQRPVMRVNFMGLTGPSGMLPRSYTERLQQIDAGTRHDERDALRDWLDNFNHRLLSLFFDAWSKYRYPIAIRRQWIEPDSHRSRPPLIRVALASIAGLDRWVAETDSQVQDASERSSPKDHSLRRDELLGLAGVLAQRPMNVCNLEAALQRSLGVRVRVRQFQGDWLRLEPESQTSLGVSNSVLGSDAVVGERICSRSQKILLELGPLSWEDFQRCLPPTPETPSDAYQRLVELVRLCIGPGMEFDICPRMRVESPLDIRLSAIAETNRLGIDSWLGTPLNTEIADDAVFAGTV